MKTPNSKQGLAQVYQTKSSQYNTQLKIFGLFSGIGFDLSGWRTNAIEQLALQPGDTVVDIGCGTGLNLQQLHDAVTEDGKIIAVDLSREMLDQAQKLVHQNQWNNVELVCADAETYRIPDAVDAVISVYTLILTANAGQIIDNIYHALKPGGRIVVLDMAWPERCPLWWRHVLFFLKSYGVTRKVIQTSAWKTVQHQMKQQFHHFTQKEFWFGFFYLARAVKAGTHDAADNQHTPQ